MKLSNTNNTRKVKVSSRYIAIYVVAFLTFLSLPVVGQNRCGSGYSGTIDLDRHTPTSQTSARSTLQVQLVFHVFTLDLNIPISPDLIYNQMDILNHDFNPGMNSFDALPPELKTVAGDAQISFCLASSDPDGNPTNGYVYYDTDDPDLGKDRMDIKYTDLGGVDAWDTEKYINIWVAHDPGALGIATFPNTTIQSEQGIILREDIVGGYNNGNQQFNEGKTLTHELGHFFGLEHPWGKERFCQVDDGISDTPIQRGPYFGCPAYPQSSCDSPDFIYNYMDFSDDACLLYFTKEQAKVMRSILMTERNGLLDNGCMSKNETNLQNVEWSISKGYLIVNSASNNILNLDISFYDLVGRKVAQSSLKGYSHYQYICDIVTGIYIIVLDDGEQRLTQKVFFVNEF